MPLNCGQQRFRDCALVGMRKYESVRILIELDKLRHILNMSSGTGLGWLVAEIKAREMTAMKIKALG